MHPLRSMWLPLLLLLSGLSVALPLRAPLGVGRSSSLFASPSASSSPRPSSNPAGPDGVIELLSGGREPFRAAVDSNRVVAFRFFAPWCRACRGMRPHFKRMAQGLLDDGQPVSFFEVDVSDKPSKDLVLDLEIRALPYVAVYLDGGGPVDAAPCGMSKVPALSERMDALLADLPPPIEGAASANADEEAAPSAAPSREAQEAAETTPAFVRSSPGTAMSNELAEWNRFRLVLASTRAFINSRWNARLQNVELRRRAVGSLSAGQKRQFRAAFDALDLDTSGQISLTELKAALEQVGMTPKDGVDLSKTMNMADPRTAGTDFLDFEAFLAMMACDRVYDDTISAGKAASKAMMDVFQRFEDPPGSGFISAPRIRQGLESLDPPLHLSESAAQALVDEFDIDGDGQINYYEFVRMLAVDTP